MINNIDLTFFDRVEEIQIHPKYLNLGNKTIERKKNNIYFTLFANYFENQYFFIQRHSLITK